ncbi:MAG: hypothetical protein J6Q81_05035 [Lentisphaeria bacterium]|nr:hypothetical protein [Lentisphaeria bacterium]
MNNNTLLKLFVSLALIVQGVITVNGNPLIPMGALTGKPNREQIRTILEKYKAVGIDQYLVYPRSGCELDYLSTEYLDTLEIFCEEAEKLNFSSLWLYDEFNWPSGSCGKRVPQENPKFAMPFICAFKQDGKIKVEIRHNPNYTALMNPAAVDRFIELTHEQYYKRLKPYFGKLIKGIFTDEPEIGYFGSQAKDTIFCMGYYEGLEDDYRKLTGGDLFEDIAAGLRGDPDFYPKACTELLAKRFRSTYVDRLQAWCEKHNIVLTGHLMNETQPELSRKSNGNILKVLPGFGLPGMDEINTFHSIVSSDWMAMGTCMYAVDKRGNKGGLGELFALGPCDLSFTRLNKMLFTAAAFGVNHYILAISPVDSRGCAFKPKWYNSFAADQPHLEVFDKWKEYAQKAAKLAGKERVYEIGVRYGNGAERLPDLLNDLVRHQISWCLLDNDEEAPEDLPMVLTILPHNGRIKEEKIVLGGHNFDYLWEVGIKVHFKLSSIVCNPAGDKVEDVFVRRYRDGSVLVIDMAGKDRELVLHRNNQKEPFMLYAHGVKIFEPQMQAAEKAAGATQIVAPAKWSVAFDSPHLCRVNFNDDNTAVFELKKTQHLRMAFRKYQCDAQLEFNGKLLTDPQECTELPYTFKNLYQTFDLGVVPAGKYTLKLRTPAVDYPFLPLAIFIGSDLIDYVGKITQDCEYTLPATAKKFRIANIPTPGAAEILLNGVSLGKCITKPYEWAIPADWQGKTVKITVKQWTTVGGLFGIPWIIKDELSRWSQTHRAPKRRAYEALQLEIE